MDADPTVVASAIEAHHSSVQMLAIMIPIVAIVMGIGMGMLGLWFDFRRKKQMFELHHLERMAAIEKGIELPALPAEFYSAFRKSGPRTPAETLRSGLVLLLVGIAIVVALSYQQHQLSLWGLIPAAVGLAYLIAYAIGRRAPAPVADDGSRPAR